MNASRTLRAVPALIFSAVLLAGCSSITTASDSPSTAPSVPSVAPSVPSAIPSAPGTPASPVDLCTSFDNLKTSIGDLRKINPLSGGVASIQTALDNVRTQLDAFQAAARTDFGPEITGLRTSLTGVQSALAAAKASPGVSTIAQVAGSVVGVGTAYNTLHTAVSARCN